MSVQKSLTKVRGYLTLKTGEVNGEDVKRNLSIPALSPDAENEQIFTLGDAIQPILRYPLLKTLAVRRYVLENN